MDSYKIFPDKEEQCTTEEKPEDRYKVIETSDPDDFEQELNHNALLGYRIVVARKILSEPFPCFFAVMENKELDSFFG